MTAVQNSIRDVKDPIIRAFRDNDLKVQPKGHYYVAQSSKVTAEKVENVLVAAGFSPVISTYQIEGKFAFTVAPCHLEGLYLERDEAECLLKKYKFKRVPGTLPEERNLSMTVWRSYVQNTANKVFSDVINSFAKPGYAVLEAGATHDYHINLRNSPLVRTHPLDNECIHFKHFWKNTPIYQLQLEALAKVLQESDKKFPLVFGINYFDETTSDNRLKEFSNIANMQNPGDKLLLLMDYNPCISTILCELEKDFPDEYPYPYFPEGPYTATMQAILVPSKHGVERLPLEAFLDVYKDEVKNIKDNITSEIQSKLIRLQQRESLKTICFESYFLEKVKKELDKAGYSSRHYYHAAFKIDRLHPKLPEHNLNFDLLYKAVGDPVTIRHWNFSDPKFTNLLKKKNLQIPSEYKKMDRRDFKANKLILQGVEVLVVESTKR